MNGALPGAAWASCGSVTCEELGTADISGESGTPLDRLSSRPAGLAQLQFELEKYEVCADQNKRELHYSLTS